MTTSNDDLVGGNPYTFTREELTCELRLVKAPFQDIIQQKVIIVPVDADGVSDKSGHGRRAVWRDIPVVRQDQLPKEIV